MYVYVVLSLFGTCLFDDEDEESLKCKKEIIDAYHIQSLVSPRE